MKEIAPGKLMPVNDFDDGPEIEQAQREAFRQGMYFKPHLHEVTQDIDEFFES